MRQVVYKGYARTSQRARWSARAERAGIPGDLTGLSGPTRPRVRCDATRQSGAVVKAARSARLPTVLARNHHWRPPPGRWRCHHTVTIAG
jgi:hypothetical protein